MTALNKIDSNVTGLRYAEEASYKVLPAAPVWYPQEPNSYADFGGEISTVARNPINSSRQRKKGVVVDLDASGGYEQDLTQTNSQDLLQGFLFASLRRKAEAQANSVPIIAVDGSAETVELSNLQCTVVDSVAAGGTGYAVGDTITLTGGTLTTAVVLTVATLSGSAVATVTITTAGRYSVAPSDPVAQGSSSGGGTGATFNLTFGPVITLAAGDLILLSGFGDEGNNTFTRITSVTTADVLFVVAADLTTDASPASGADLVKVGVQAGAGDLDVDASGALPTITSTTLDFTTLGLVAGEFIYIGGDTASLAFATAANNGFARVRSIAANILTLDKAQGTMVTEASTTETVQLFLGRVLKNELGSNIIRRTYQFERELGAPDDASPSDVQAEYLIGCVPSEFSFNIPTADKLVTNLSFIGADNETIDGPTSLKTGTRPALVEADAFNTSSDVSRIKMAQVVAGDENPDPLFAFLTDLTINVNNNATPNKAVGILGAFEVTAGTFEVGGEVTAYFADVAAIAAVRANADVTIDAHVVKSNAGISIDLPLISLGDGRPSVDQDEPITLPITFEAATGAKVDPALDHTMLLMFWDYLPSAAA